MSNEACLDLYERVISAVVEESRQDFEDCGVDEATLIELGTIWREKLQQAQRLKQHQHQTQLDNVMGKGSLGDLVKKESDQEDDTSKFNDNEDNNNNNNYNTTNNNDNNINTTNTTTANNKLRGDKDDEEIHESDDEDEDEEDEEDEEEDEGDVILCLYERVQRVRNRWKCQLREGMASLQGRDYVFAKASGDSEW